MTDRAKHWFRVASSNQLVRYVVVGGIGYVVNLVVFAGLVAIHPGLEYVALVPAYVANTWWNFAANRAWTFAGSTGSRSEHGRRFTVVAVAMLVLNYATFHVSFGVLGIPAVPAQAIAVIVGVPVGFLANKFWTFADQERSATLASPATDPNT